MIKTTDNFRKAIYWSMRKMMAHADRYSPAFSAEMYEKIQNGEVPEKDMWRYSSFWYKNFDEMAIKTMLRHIISKWGPVSIEMEKAIPEDREESDFDYTYADSDNQILQQSDFDMIDSTDDLETADEMDNREQVKQEEQNTEISEQEEIDIDSI